MFDANWPNTASTFPGLWHACYSAPQTKLAGTPSAHRLLDECGDLRLVGGGQRLQRVGNRPQGAVVEVRAVVEAERRVPRLELLRGLEEADDLAVFGIRGHPVPRLRREVWRAGRDDRVQPFGHGAIRCRHLGDLREHVALAVRLVRARLLLLDALPHRGSFRVRESLVRLRRLLRRLLVIYSHGGLSFAVFGG